MKVCVPTEYMEKVSDSVKAKIKNAIESLEKGGATVEYVSFTDYEAVQSAWFIMMCAESCNNLSRYEGVKFGYRTAEYSDIEELYTKSRTEAFGLLTKSVILYGSDVLSKNRYFSAYDKSLKVRRAARNSLNELFGKYDLILAPVSSETEYKDADMGTVYNESYFTSLGMMMGLPTVAVGGVQLMGNSFCEKKLFAAAEQLTEVE
jgi:aspartyl-tRNA(Asn)/glutamyl-tRNA(Gln) amidotransferase subunit A